MSSSVEYKIWLDSLKPGDQIVSLSPSRYNDIAYLKERVVKRRTATQIVFSDGLRVKASDGKFIGGGHSYLEYPAQPDEIDAVRHAHATADLLRKVKIKIDGNLSFEQLTQIMAVLEKK